jgi:hypothetical protein
MKFENFAMLSYSRPIKVSLEEATQAFGEAISSGSAPEGRRHYLTQRWVALSEKLMDGEQLWIFEAGGTVTEPKRGIAREQDGRVTDFLIF